MPHSLSQNTVLLRLLELHPEGLTSLDVQTLSRSYRDVDGHGCRMICRAGARVWELRKEGHDIEGVVVGSDGDGCPIYRYRLAKFGKPGTGRSGREPQAPKSPPAHVATVSCAPVARARQGEMFEVMVTPWGTKIAPPGEAR